MTHRKAAHRSGRAATVVVVGLYGVAVGAAAGVWFSQRYLQPHGPPTPAAKPVAPLAEPTAISQAAAQGFPSVARAETKPAPVVRLTRVDDASQQAEPEPRGSRPATPAPGSAVPRLQPFPTPRPSTPAASAQGQRKRSRESLYTCPNSRHLDATRARPGKCRICGSPLVLAEREPHGLQAMAWYAEHERTTRPAATQRLRGMGFQPIKTSNLPPVAARPAASRPASRPAVARVDPPARQRRTLYTCRRRDHIAATSDRPGTCALCRADLVRVEKVPHGFQAIRYYADHESGAGTVSTAEHPPLFTCPTAQHVDVTGTRPGKCSRCDLALLPVERVGHEARAVRAWRKKQRSTSTSEDVRRTDERQPIVLYTCPDLAHVDVTTNRPGKCPRCALTMRPVDEVIHTTEAVEAFVNRLRQERARRAAAAQ